MTSTTWRARFRAGWPWLLLGLWAALQLAIAWRVQAQEQGPIDFLAYQVAADKITHGTSPYASASADLAIWRAYHRLEEQLHEPRPPAPPVTPGPYLYPPTLALLIADTGVGAVGFASLIVLSVFGFAWIWLQATGMSALWLLFIVLSWDIFAAASGGNVELVLLGVTLAACRLLWSAQPLLATPLMAVVLVVKPFYALVFAGFALILLSSRPVGNAPRFRSVVGAAVLTLALLVLEAYRWGPVLRAETGDFMSNSLAHQWFVLPVAEQTPMSTWNRTAMQGLVNAGVPAHLALWGAFALWLIVLAWTGWRVRNRPVTFPQAFALAFVLLYWGRPVGWTLNYLEMVVLAAIWPTAGARMRGVLLLGAGALMLSHWWSLVLTGLGRSLALVTLQSADAPWETWLVVPLAWWLLVSRSSPRLYQRIDSSELNVVNGSRKPDEVER